MAKRLLTVGGPTLPFPIRRVYCVGRNYAEHRKEMGGNDRDDPFFFAKPHDAVYQGDKIHYPRGTSQLSYEGEFVVIMNSPTEAYGYCVGVDLTKRDLQEVAKKQGRPWEAAKAFDNSGILGLIQPATKGTYPPSHVTLKFLLNGETRQSASIGDMIWSSEELINKLKEQDFSVAQGDVIFTGTPAGVGQLSVGDVCSVQLTDEDGNHVVPELHFSVVV